MKPVISSETQLIYFRECLAMFQIFTDEEWALFSVAITFQALKKKELLFDIGEIYQAMAFIYEGGVRYFIKGEDRLITNYFAFKSELVAAYSSFISGKPSLVGVEAIEKAQLLIIHKRQFDSLCENPAIAFKLEQMRRRIAEHYILCYEERIGTFLLQSPEQRYYALLSTGGENLQRIPQHYVADYLGITPVSLSRIRNRSLKRT